MVDGAARKEPAPLSNRARKFEHKLPNSQSLVAFRRRDFNARRRRGAQFGAENQSLPLVPKNKKWRILAKRARF
jgi:hypothetical protein